ncbi:unnamed protein product [Diabrotica balteata]|uniref:Reverse transcriptase domain-containing protein n=1 Tax=Diabrotica balteata TaxID=107213 RepID=A0A9N9SQM7_DIABA|nr:unnamed protein product [Diabrotica balteata]
MTISNLEATVRIQEENSRILLFNIALEEAVRDTRIRDGSTIYNRLIQVLAYADDIHIRGRSKRDNEQYLLELETAAKQTKPSTCWLQRVT